MKVLLCRKEPWQNYPPPGNVSIGLPLRTYKQTKTFSLCWHTYFHHTNLKDYVRSYCSKTSVAIAIRNKWKAEPLASSDFSTLTWQQQYITAHHMKMYILHSFRGLVVDHTLIRMTAKKNGIVWPTVMTFNTTHLVVFYKLNNKDNAVNTTVSTIKTIFVFIKKKHCMFWPMIILNI